MTAAVNALEATADPPVAARLPILVAAIVGLQLFAALVILAFGDGPVGTIETDHEWVNVLAPAYTIEVWHGASAWANQWGGLLASFLALPVGLLVDRMLRRSAGRIRIAWWTLLWLAVVITLGFQTVGTLDALQLL